MIFFCFSSSSALRTSLAKYVPPLRSLTITLSIFAPRARKMFASRSWVSGRSFFVPCLNIAIATPTVCSNHENLVLVAKKNRTAAAGRSDAADLHLDNGLTHTADLVTRLLAKIRIAFPFSFVPLLCQKCDPLEFQATVQRARVFGGRTS